MSYRISYGPKTPKKYYSAKAGSKKIVLFAAIAGIVLTAVIAFPAQMQTLRHKLLPWTTPESKVAISTMLADIEAGAAYEDAIAAFCRDILSGVIDEE